MLVKTAKILVAGAALGAVAVLSACSGPNSAQPSNGQPIPASSVVQSPAPLAVPQPSGAVAPAAATPAPVPVKHTKPQAKPGTGQGGGVTSGDVNCTTAGGGTVGPRKVQLIANATKAGTVGCTEAYNVVSEYFANLDKADGVSYMLTVQGWNCYTDTGAEGSHEIRCAKDGLKFHTTAPDPNTVPDTQDQGTGYHGMPIDNPDAK